MAYTLQMRPTCHGDWAAAGLKCSLTDLLFDTWFAAQLFDWQNIVFLCFMPLLLLIATFIFRVTYRASGNVKLEDIFSKKAGDLNQIYKNWSNQAAFDASLRNVGQNTIMGTISGNTNHPPPMYTSALLSSQEGRVSGTNMGHEDDVEVMPLETPEASTPANISRAAARAGEGVEMTDVGESSAMLDPSQVPLHTSTHPTDVDPRNIAIMINLAAFIISMGMVCWASISDFVDVSAVDFMSDGIYAQGFNTQTLPRGVTQRGVNIGWGVCWLCIGGVLMTFAQFFIRLVIMKWDGSLDVCEAVLAKGNIAAAICEAGHQIAMGLVVSASISGPYAHFGYDLAGCLLFYTLSLLLLMIWSKIFDLYTTDWDTWKEIARGNTAAGITQFCEMVSTALLLNSSISKTFELGTLFSWWAVGSVVRTVFRFVLDVLLIAPRWCKPRYTREQLKIDKMILRGNWGAALVVGMLQIILTCIINAFLPDSCTAFTYSDGRNTRSMTLNEKLAATEYIKTVYKYDRMVALAIIFALFLLARPPYELRLWVHSKLVSQRIHQHTSPHVSGASGVESGATPGAAPRQGAPGLRLAQAAGVLSAVRRWRRRSLDALPAPMDPDLNHHIFEQRKHAICISFGAYLVAVGNMLVGVFRDGNYGTSFVDNTDPSAWGYLFLQILVGYLMLMAAFVVTDLFILHKFDNVHLMAAYDNRAIALIEGGSLIGSSFCVSAVINGWNYSSPFYASAVIFFFATQLLMVVFQLVFEAITPYDDRKEAELGNAAAGLNNGLNLIAVGMLLARSAYLSHSLVMLVCWAVVAYPLIFGVRYLTDFVVLIDIDFEATLECLDRFNPNMYAPRRPSRQGNWGTALVGGLVTIAFVQLLNTFLRDCPFTNGIPVLVTTV